MKDCSISAPVKQDLDGIIGRHAGKSGALLGILEDAQAADASRYLSEPTLRYIADRTGEALSRIYSIVTFYSYFNLMPQGRHSIVVCRGTACHTRGSRQLLEEATAQLGAKDFREEEESSFTTADLQFTVKTVACFGQCALSPVVALDSTIYSRMTVGKLLALIGKMAKAGKR
jgi:NADH-quinone oxidoreductase subunit E